jgi:hypothetical protein
VLVQSVLRLKNPPERPAATGIAARHAELAPRAVQWVTAIALALAGQVPKFASTVL